MRLGEAVRPPVGRSRLHGARDSRRPSLLSRAGETPKAGHGRTLDMSQQLARVLRRLEIDRKAETLRRGWREVPPWIFCSDAGTPLDHNNVAKTFKRVLQAAGLPLHFTPHGLRHTFASLLLSAQVSPAYVQRQLESRVDQADRRDLRPMAPDGQQGGDRRTGRQGDHPDRQGPGPQSRGRTLVRGARLPWITERSARCFCPSGSKVVVETGSGGAGCPATP